MTAEWKLTYEDMETAYGVGLCADGDPMAVGVAGQRKLLEYLRANPPEDSYGCVAADPQYTEMFESMLTELEAQHE